MKQTAVFVLICAVGIGIGGHLASALFFGIITLVGLIALVENIPLIKWFVYKTNNFIDVMLFILAVIATVKMGVTITAALTVAGLGYTMCYAPYVRRKKKENREVHSQNKVVNERLSKNKINY
jgi:Ca2+/Na+ antiporter